MRNNRALLIILALMITSCIFAIGFSTDTLKVTTQFWFGGVNVSSFFGTLNGSNQVTSSGIADGSIDEDKITTGAVQTTHIEDGTIAWADVGAAVKDSIRIGYDATIGAGEINTTQLADYAVTGIKIFDGVVTSAKITDNTIAWDDLSGTVQSAISSGGSLTEGSVTGFHIANETITGDDIAAEAVGNLQIAPGAIEGIQIQSATIAMSNLNAALKDSIRLGYEASGIPLDNSVTSAKIVDATITSGDLSEALQNAIADIGTPLDNSVGWAKLTAAVQDSIKNPAWDKIFLPETGSDSTGAIFAAGYAIVHSYGRIESVAHDRNLFIGKNAGNFTLNTTAAGADGALLGIGKNALHNVTSGTDNIALGYNALTSLTSSTDNTAIGDNTLKTITAGGNSNTAIGKEAGQAVTTGDNNTFIGKRSGFALTTGGRNSLIGYLAGDGMQGEKNTIIGADADFTGTGNFNIIIGADKTLPANSSNAINIGNVFYSFSSGDSVGIGTATPADLFHMEFATNKDVRAGLGSDGSTYTTLRSPDGSLWYITVNNSGVISASATKP